MRSKNSIQFYTIFFFLYYKLWKSWDKMQNYVTIYFLRMLEHESTYKKYALVTAPNYRFDLTNGIEVLLSV